MTVGRIRARPRGRGAPLVELQVSAGTEATWLRELPRRWPIRARVRVCRPLLRSPPVLLQVVELVGAAGDLEVAERWLEHAPGVHELSIVRPAPHRRLLRIVGPLSRPCERVFRTGALCASCRYLPDLAGKGVERWTLLFPGRRETRDWVDTVRELPETADLEVFRTREYRLGPTLTARQSEALETAHRLGFYEFPRRADLGRVARTLGIRRSAAAELLRRAEAKALDPAAGGL